MRIYIYTCMYVFSDAEDLIVLLKILKVLSKHECLNDHQWRCDQTNMEDLTCSVYQTRMRFRCPQSCIGFDTLDMADIFFEREDNTLIASLSLPSSLTQGVVGLIAS